MADVPLGEVEIMIKLIKICLRKEIEEIDINEMVLLLKNLKYVFHMQVINNDYYKKLVKGMKTVDWMYIFNIYLENRDEDKIENIYNVISKNINKSLIDIYVVTEYTYKEPINGANLITSCYLWNKLNTQSSREKVMSEHFEMEKEEKYYEYISFQTVQEKYTDYSQDIDFFFEAHVIDKSGIEKIYATPKLKAMRVHSSGFLNIDTRKLSFGSVFVHNKS